MIALLLAFACSPDPKTDDTGPTETAEDCTNAADDDGDGLVDCDDSDCADDSACAGGTTAAEDCGAAGDEDGDGLADCEDPDCTDSCDEDCFDGSDNDADALVDCEDGECADVIGCIEDCSNDEDDDGDGLSGCDDDDCWGENRCATVTAQVTGGSGQFGSYFQVTYDRRTYGTSGGAVFTNTYMYSQTFTRMEANDVTGTLLVEWPDGDTATCTWSVDTVQAEGGRSRADWHPTRTGWTTSGDCGGVGSSVLPQTLSWANRDNRVRAQSYSGVLWYSGAGVNERDRQETADRYTSSFLTRVDDFSGGEPWVTTGF